MLSDWAFRFQGYRISDRTAGRPISASFARHNRGLQFSAGKPGDLSDNG